ncbi:SDR family NAD(P)-dependent oxidoreductase [Mucilaginibacter sp. RS28]|uniref:SDR family NAD(P)-dependent oxidoreductase n=1 Tax=Mucilaginibacter straminoryzae TaxID=2932774 RepID=A0A9X2BEJ7_9SPHI|nr:SDR family NAD(P)-dependent oxidoreductase [Mucilaginibacter straminoryzae]MCJ8211473.1 SDR family NAD(P)-dependent oxidoreductase [Mucilaginibacter straminoryzae]
MKRVVSILGCGWYGLALAKSLLVQGDVVKGSVTKTEKLNLLSEYGIQPFLVDLQKISETPKADPFFDCDILVIACNVNLAKRPNYLLEIEGLIQQVRTSLIKKVLFISSISIYGEPGTVVDEQSLPQPNTESARLLSAAEALFLAETRFEVTILRFGGLVGPGRMPGRFLSGKKQIPNGLAPVNLIHLKDCVGLTEAVINSKAHIPILNGVSPAHPTRNYFYCLAAAVEKLPAPEFILEKNDWKEVNSRYGTNFYQYQITDWKNWLLNPQLD